MRVLKHGWGWFLFACVAAQVAEHPSHAQNPIWLRILMGFAAALSLMAFGAWLGESSDGWRAFIAFWPWGSK